MHRASARNVQSSPSRPLHHLSTFLIIFACGISSSWKSGKLSSPGSLVAFCCFSSVTWLSKAKLFVAQVSLSPTTRFRTCTLPRPARCSERPVFLTLPSSFARALARSVWEHKAEDPCSASDRLERQQLWARGAMDAHLPLRPLELVRHSNRISSK